MTIRWDIWVFFALLAVSAIAFLAEGIVRLRVSHGKAWKAVGFCTLAMVFCLVGTLGNYSFYSLSVSGLELLKKPPEPSHLRPDWGADMSKEDRTKYSQMLARISFENWHITVNYFDETGTLRPYRPTDADRGAFHARRQAIALHEENTNLLKWVTLAWLFVPWLGLLAAFVPWSVRVLGALTNRPKSDALQPGSAPLG
jgi:hypothetical protein